AELELSPEPGAGPREPEELLEALGFLGQLGPDALLSMALRKPPAQRTQDELELIFEELLHIKAVAHLSNSVGAAVSPNPAGSGLFSQGDKGTSWYIIWKGSVNVVTHGKGLVATLHEGDDFGQLALVNDAPRAATILLREDNCHFLRVDKHDFNRILKDVEANTVRLKEHGKVVLGQERCHQPGTLPLSPPRVPSRYLVMAGTPEKILEHLLEFMRLDATVYDPVDTLLGDFLLTYTVFMPTSQLCRALLHHFRAEPLEGSEQDKAAYSLRKRRKILRLVSQWVLLYGRLLQGDRSTTALLQVRGGDTAGTARGQRGDSPELSPPPAVPPEPGGPGEPGREGSGVFSRAQTPHPEQLGPHAGSSDTLDLISSKELASHLTDYDWSLFKSIHQVEMIHYIVGPQKFHEVATANLARVMRRFNELQFWVATELCLCPELGRRAQLLRKFIKLAAHLKEQKNLNSFFAVMFGVSNTAVTRLAKTWERLPHKIRKLHSALERMLDPSWNHRVYRLAVAKLSPPIIPFVPLLLKGLC
uniref:Rap guanine nucleotide exchange factor 3 n=1 Tax=Ficedula albicollis TaxID=59894 RepID=U3K715_FICAL